MTRHIFSIVAATALFPLPAFAQDLPLGALAAQMPRAAVAAIGFRDEGKPKEFLTKALPEKSPANNRTAREMHQIADDVYGFPELRGLPYFVYTRERFARELRGEPGPSRFEEVAVPVLACQAIAKADEWLQLQACMTEGGSKNCLAESKWQTVIQCVTNSVQAFSPAK